MEGRKGERVDGGREESREGRSRVVLQGGRGKE